FAAREKDWVDLEGVIIRQTDAIDWAYVRTHLGPLAELKEEPEILNELERGGPHCRRSGQFFATCLSEIRHEYDVRRERISCACEHPPVRRPGEILDAARCEGASVKMRDLDWRPAFDR